MVDSLSGDGTVWLQVRTAAANPNPNPFLYESTPHRRVKMGVPYHEWRGYCLIAKPVWLQNLWHPTDHRYGMYAGYAVGDDQMTLVGEDDAASRGVFTLVPARKKVVSFFQWGFS